MLNVKCSLCFLVSAVLLVWSLRRWFLCAAWSWDATTPRRNRLDRWDWVRIRRPCKSPHAAWQRKLSRHPLDHRLDCSCQFGVGCLNGFDVSLEVNLRRTLDGKISSMFGGGSLNSVFNSCVDLLAASLRINCSCFVGRILRVESIYFRQDLGIVIAAEDPLSVWLDLNE